MEGMTHKIPVCLGFSNVPDVHDGKAVKGWPGLEPLIALIVHEEELLVHWVVDLALMGVI